MNIRMLLRRLVSSDATPVWFATLAQQLRMGGGVARRVRNPLSRVPELDVRLRDTWRHNSFAISHQDRARQLAMAVEYAVGTGVNGDVAEFGTMTGTTARVLAAAIRAFGHLDSKRSLHLFDSFQGLPEARGSDLEMYEVATGHWAEGQCYGVGPKLLTAMCARFLHRQRIVIHKGWFKDTLPLLAEGHMFSVVHLDCDLYQSTFDVLDLLLARRHIGNGAMLLFDDWLCSRADRQHGQQRAWHDACLRHHPEFTFLGYYGAGCARLIIHK